MDIIIIVVIIIIIIIIITTIIIKITTLCYSNTHVCIYGYMIMSCSRGRRSRGRPASGVRNTLHCTLLH